MLEIEIILQATNEDAIHFYRRFGFEIFETVKNFYRRIQDDKVALIYFIEIGFIE